MSNTSDENLRGIVYVLTNSAMPGLVKIGRTRRESLNDRLNELYGTGVPVPFECAFAGRVEDATKVEKALHTAFGPSRYNPSREFFAMEAYQAIEILKLLVSEEVTTEISKEADDVDPQSKQAQEQYKKRRSNFNFYEMGVPEGAELMYVKDHECICCVIDERRVHYDGEDVSLTALTTKLHDSSYNIAPLPHWLFRGRLLSEIYNETYD